MKSSTKIALLIASIISVSLILNLSFDRDYWATVLLPVIYGLGILLFFKPDIYKYGPCSICLIFFYAFRMCLLPVICAWGNFYMEISKNLYIQYYTASILLMCLEFLIVILSTNYFCKRTLKKNIIIIESINHKLLNVSALSFAIIIVAGLVLIAPNYFHFILGEVDEDPFAIETVHQGMWYVLDLACTLGRPLVCFVLVYYGMSKGKVGGYIIVAVVIVSNFLFLTDRRIFSFLISGVCLYYVLLTVKSKFISRTLLSVLGLAAVAAIYVSFYYQFGEGNEFISRTFEHYFSGPSLTAIGLVANNSVDYKMTDFFNFLFNDFHVLNVIFGKYQVTNFYDDVFGFSKGFWTPMFVGGIRYFGILAPLFIVGFTKFIVFCDYKTRCYKDHLAQMIYVFMGVALSCYMIMYMLELILYYLMTTVVLYSLLVHYSNRRDKKTIVISQSLVNNLDVK